MSIAGELIQLNTRYLTTKVETPCFSRWRDVLSLYHSFVHY